MEFIRLEKEDSGAIYTLSKMATEIVREHFDPIIGKAQNDYMIGLFQTEESIYNQLEHGYRYYFVKVEDKNVGFLAFYPRNDAMYLSKFYLYKEERHKGYARKMTNFIIEQAKKENIYAIELNVNRNNSACQSYERLGYKIIRLEKNDIGQGFFMDDYVYRLDF